MSNVFGDTEQPVPSPCVGICCPDDNDVCMGCFRTMAEITQWWEMSDTEKRELLKLLPGRRN